MSNLFLLSYTYLPSMTLVLKTCKHCGGMFPLLSDNESQDFCVDCFQKQKIEKEEFEWRNITFGYSCPSGKCNI